MKRLMIIADGMADEPRSGVTPLSEASVPAMDRLARSGITGLIDTAVRAADGMRLPPESQQAIGMLLGYRNLGGRGAFEALGIGYNLRPDREYARCNFIDAAGEPARTLSEEDNRELCRRISADGLLPLMAYQPGRNIAELCIGADFTEACRVASHRLPAFGVVAMELLSPSPSLQLEQFASLWPGVGRAACVCGAAVVRGLASAVGMHIVRVAGATGGIDTDLSSKLRGAMRCFDEGYDFVLIHIEAPDECSHMRRPDTKRRIIERIDREVVAPALDWLEEGAAAHDDRRVLLTSDHRTDSIRGIHTVGPMPATLAGVGINPGIATSFSELTVEQTMLDLARFYY